MTVAGPMPGQPGHLADHEALAAELLALEGPRHATAYYPPEVVAYRPDWMHGYVTPGVHIGVTVARVGQTVFLSGMTLTTVAKDAGSPAFDLPPWAWPDYGIHILNFSGNRVEVSPEGYVYYANAMPANSWFSLSHAYTLIRTEE